MVGDGLPRDAAIHCRYTVSQLQHIVLDPQSQAETRPRHITPMSDYAELLIRPEPGHDAVNIAEEPIDC